MPNSKPLHVALFTTLARDLRYAAVLIRSIVKESAFKSNFIFHFVYAELGPEELTLFSRSLSDLEIDVRLHSIDKFIGDRLSKPAFGYWAWLWFEKVLPKSLDRLLYIDCDMICLRDITPIWNLELGGKVAAMVPDPGTRVHGCSESLSRAAPKLGLNFSADRSYFNAGLVFMDVARWREQRLLELVDHHIKDYEVLRFHDQDAINLFLKDKVMPLSPEWNLIESIHLYEAWDFELYHDLAQPQQYFEPRLRHFSGDMKPDGKNSRTSDRELFYAYLDETCWNGWRGEGSKGLLSHLWGQFLEFHYLVVRGVKQKALLKPSTKLLSLSLRAPYLPLIYPLLPLYRQISKLTGKI